MQACRAIRLFVFLSLAGAARGQLSSLATTDDGSVAWLATGFRLKGGGSGGIFVLDAEGIRLYADEVPGYPATGLGIPQVSGDGSVVAITGTWWSQGCPPPLLFCANPPVNHAVTLVRRAGADAVAYDGAVRMSGNGRFFLLPGPALLDTVTGYTTNLLVATDPWSGQVASDGSVFYSRDGQAFLWRGDTGVKPLPVPVEGYPLLDDSATGVIYSVAHYNTPDPQTWTYTLYRLDLATGETRLLANGLPASVSRDGRRIAFLSPGGSGSQAWVVGPDGDNLQQVTDDSGGVSWVKISGGANVVYVATAANRLVKIDLAGGGTTEIVPPVPVPGLAEPYAILTPGRQQTLNVAGLVQETLTAEPPLPTELGGIRVLVNGVAAPLFSVSPSGVHYQIPWETPPAGAQAVVDVPGAVFESPVALLLAQFAPAFQTHDCGGGQPPECITAVHSDSGAPVSTDHPARASESVDLFMYGLGTVTPPAVDGVPAPASPPSVIDNQPVCWLLQTSQAPPPPTVQYMQVLSARLAPGTIGVYVVTVKLPAQVLKLSNLKCASPGGVGGEASGWLPTDPNPF